MDKKILRKYVVGDFTVRRLIRSVGFIYACLLVFTLVWSDRMIFLPQPSSYRDGDEILKIPIGNGSSISAIYLDNPESEYTIFYNHANAVDLGDVL